VKPEKTRPRIPPGRQLYDPLNGFRVGGFAGALIASLVVAAVGMAYVWLALVGAVLGGAIGYWSERRRLYRTPPDASRADRTAGRRPEE